MPIRFEGETARFTGDCAVDEAPPLAEWLEAAAKPRADLAACTGLHTALLQLLLAGGGMLAAPPRDPFPRAWVAPLLAVTPPVGSAGG